MGIIIHDTITLKNGLQVSNVYANLAGHTIRTDKVPVSMSNTALVWTLTTNYKIWANQNAANNGLPCLQDFPLTLKNIDPSQSPMPLLYSVIKSNYENTSDV